MRILSGIFGAILTASILLAGPAFANATDGLRQSEAETVVVNASRTSDYRLGTGDKVRVTVYDETDLSGEFEVDATGYVRLPLIGQVNAGGATAYQLEGAIEQALHGRFSDHDIFAIRLALEEALVNAIKHGNQMDQAKNVHVVYHVAPDRFEVKITDEGPGFDPCDVPDPTSAENIERPCGRGLLLMRHYMTEVAYHDRGRAVHMAKVRNGVK